MTRKEHLEFCKRCLNRKFDAKQGIICNLTDKIADFEENCENFKLDESVKEQQQEEISYSNEEIISELNEDAIERLKIHQDFYFAIAGGLLAALVSAIIWATITVATEFQIGYMAIAVGLFVGYAVRFFGAGIDMKFGVLGAVLSLLGCILGNLFGQVGFIAQEYSLGYFETLTYLNFGLIAEIMAGSFHPMDVLFYGIAIFEGYKFAFRKVSAEEIKNLASADYEAYPPNYKLRLPLVITSVVIMTLFVFMLNKGVSGYKTFKYESGKKMSEGKFVDGKEDGEWTYWYENGSVQLKGYYNNGINDSTWQWYSELGSLIRIGNYKKGLEHGTWMNYYENGNLSDSGEYVEGRMNGLWKYWHENGNLSQIGNYRRNYPVGNWTVYYDNGNIANQGNMVDGSPMDLWTYYHEDGSIESQITHHSEDKVLIENVWDKDGKQIVTDGNGAYKDYSNSGNVILEGQIKNGERIGKWTSYYEDGKLKEEGEYNKQKYFIINSWDFDGNANVKNREGIYKSYYPKNNFLFEIGEIKNGLREGQWKTYYESSGKVYIEQIYVKGELTGMQYAYFESGQIYAAGNLVNGIKEGEWNWYHESGYLSSTVNYTEGKKEGKQEMFSETGDIIKEEYYEADSLVSEKIY